MERTHGLAQFSGLWDSLTGESNEFSAPSLNERIQLFLAADMQAAQQNLDQDEILNVHRVNFDEALNMIQRGEIRDSKTISGLYLAYNYLK